MDFSASAMTAATTSSSSSNNNRSDIGMVLRGRCVGLTVSQRVCSRRTGRLASHLQLREGIPRGRSI